MLVLGTNSNDLVTSNGLHWLLDTSGATAPLALVGAGFAKKEDLAGPLIVDGANHLSLAQGRAVGPNRLDHGLDIFGDRLIERANTCA